MGRVARKFTPVEVLCIARLVVAGLLIILCVTATVKALHHGPTERADGHGGERAGFGEQGMAADIHDVVGDAWYREITDDADQQEDQISGIGIPQIIATQVSVLDTDDHILLDLGDNGPEDIGDRQPHEYIDIARQPLL